jgi:hypothetical protein
MQSRMKARDVFRTTDYPFAQKVSFEEAFPQITALSVEVDEDGNGVVKSTYMSTKQHYDKESCQKFVDCSNRLCYNGGVDIGSIIRKMVRDHTTDHEVTKFCQGYEGSPKGRKRYRPCTNGFDIKVKITYKK